MSDAQIRCNLRRLALCLAMIRPDAVNSLAVVTPNINRSGQRPTREANSDSGPMKNIAAQRTDRVGRVAPDAALASSLSGTLDAITPNILTYSDT